MALALNSSSSTAIMPHGHAAVRIPLYYVTRSGVVWPASEPTVFAASFQLLGAADKLHFSAERELKGHTFILHPKPVLPRGAHIQLFSSVTQKHILHGVVHFPLYIVCVCVCVCV